MPLIGSLAAANIPECGIAMVMLWMILPNRSDTVVMFSLVSQLPMTVVLSYSNPTGLGRAEKLPSPIILAQSDRYCWKL